GALSAGLPLRDPVPGVLVKPADAEQKPQEEQPQHERRRRVEHLVDQVADVQEEHRGDYHRKAPGADYENVREIDLPRSRLDRCLCHGPLLLSGICSPGVCVRCVGQPIRFFTTSATGFVDRDTSTAYIAKLPTASLM